MTLELRVACTVREAARVGEALTALGWGTLWIEEPLSQRTVDDGFALDAPDPGAPATVHAWPTRDDAPAPRVPERVLGHPVECVAADDDGVDWSVAWRGSHATRAEFAPGWVLVPPWATVAPGERALVIEPGGAFGTGEHPTTRHSLELLHASVREGSRVLDLGTGSGVLAIAAARFGAREVLAVDVQDDAGEHVARNAALNGLPREAIAVEVADLRTVLERERSRARWDVVCCNVGAVEVVRALEAGAQGALAQGGVLIASGVFAPSEPRVLEAARAVGLSTFARRDEDDWITLAFS